MADKNQYVENDFICFSSRCKGTIGPTEWSQGDELKVLIRDDGGLSIQVAPDTTALDLVHALAKIGIEWEILEDKHEKD